ncbi:hypothetical protein EJ06DRAFT_234618 [Trichodelitschia bisporula]|uniref:Uncharacterized protein n=1 Tax=Trichodelitschia bisporula TaxID=703511 RepID=A0A6G1HKF1_9PEZI|nr:hypothetical protein EJ06DRAFT_234618 [Trichodelitschia bisporula]
MIEHPGPPYSLSFGSPNAASCSAFKRSGFNRSHYTKMVHLKSLWVKSDMSSSRVNCDTRYGARPRQGAGIESVRVGGECWRRSVHDIDDRFAASRGRGPCARPVNVCKARKAGGLAHGRARAPSPSVALRLLLSSSVERGGKNFDLSVLISSTTAFPSGAYPCMWYEQVSIIASSINSINFLSSSRS